MQESTTKIIKLNAALDSTKTEHEQLKSSHGLTNSANQSAIDIIELKLQECEEKLNQERDQVSILESKIANQESLHIKEIGELTSNIKELTNNNQQEKRKVSSLSNSNKQLRNQLETIKQELQDYKDKAQRILQSKERLISNLKSSDVGSGDKLETSVQLEATLSELEELKAERDELKNELNKLRQSSQTAEMEYAELEGQLTKDNSDLQKSFKKNEILAKFLRKFNII